MWLATESLLTVWWRMLVSGVEIGAAPCLLALAVAHLSLCLQLGEGPVHSRLALFWYLLNPLFCEWVRLYIRAFCWKVLFFSPLSLVIPLFGLLSHISSLRLSSRHSCLVLTLRTDDATHSSLSSPYSLMADARVWATCPLAVVVRSIFCFFFFPSQLCCPLRFQNSPKTQL